MVKTTGKRRGPFRDDENFISNKCSLCGGDCGEDGYYVEGYRICRECVEQMDLSDVMDLFGFEDTGELIEALCDGEI